MRVDLDDPTEISRVIQALLEGQNKTEAAEAVGVSRQQLYRFENGTAQPTIEDLSRLAAYAGEEVIIRINAQQPDNTEDRLTDMEQTIVLLLAAVERLHGDDPLVQRLMERMSHRRHADTPQPPSDVPEASS